MTFWSRMARLSHKSIRMESRVVQIRKLLLQSVLIVTSLFWLTACGSFNKEVASETEASEVEDIDQTNSADYLCNNKPLNIFFHADQAQLTWQENDYLLTHAVSASGAFYLGERLSFWIRGDKAELELNNQEKVLCDLVRVKS